MENHKELEDMPGQMDRSMKGNWKIDLNMDLECGKEQKETHILESGNLGRQMVTVFIHGSMETDMKDILRIH